MATPKPVDPLEQILYAKNQYNQGATAGNKGLQTWAANQAKQQYGQLDPAEAAKVQAMGSSELDAYIKAKNGNLYGNTTPTTPTNQTTPTNTGASGVLGGGQYTGGVVGAAMGGKPLVTAGAGAVGTGLPDPKLPPAAPAAEAR